VAQITKRLSRAQYICAVSIWNGLSIYLPLHYQWSIPTIILIATIGNAIVAYLGTETDEK